MPALLLERQIKEAAACGMVKIGVSLGVVAKNVHHLDEYQVWRRDAALDAYERVRLLPARVEGSLLAPFDSFLSMPLQVVSPEPLLALTVLQLKCLRYFTSMASRLKEANWLPRYESLCPCAGTSLRW